MNPWHLDDDLLQRYVAGDIDLPLAGSVEAHLIGCASCRRMADGVVPRERLARIWQNIEIGINMPRPRIIQRILARLRMAFVLALARTVTSLRRPSLRALSVATGAVIFLGTPLWLAASMTNGPPETASTISSSNHNSPEPSTESLGNPASSLLNDFITAADLPYITRSLAAGHQGALRATGEYLRPCLLAATGQQATPLAAATRLYRHGTDNVSSAIIVFRSPKARNRLDVYVVKEDCTDEKGQLLETEKDILCIPSSGNLRAV
jgi:Putative zinc-finger